MTRTLTARGFLFDMDGTLVDSTAVVEGVWADMCARLGMSFEAVMATSHGRQSRSTLAEHAPWLDADEMEDAVAWLAHAEETRLEGVVEVPGAADLMAALHDAGAPVALVTSAHAALAEARMNAAGVPIPSVRITAESVSRSKPDPEGYILGARALNIPVTECLAFEDADAGIAAVTQAGASLIVVGSLSNSEAGLRVPDLRGVRLTRQADGFALTF